MAIFHINDKATPVTRPNDSGLLNPGKVSDLALTAMQNEVMQSSRLSDLSLTRQLDVAAPALLGDNRVPRPSFIESGVSNGEAALFINFANTQNIYTDNAMRQADRLLNV
jgi:hypothetical protein